MRIYKLLGVPIWTIEDRATLENPNTTLKEYFEQFGGGLSSSGINVNTQNALTLSAVWSAINILSSSLASLPVYVYKQDGRDKKLLDNDPVNILLHDRPNELMTPYTYFATMEASRNLYGNAYSFIDRTGFGEIKRLVWVHPGRVSPKLSKDGTELFYDIKDFKDNIPARDILHIKGLSFDGILGKSPIEVAKDSLGGALAVQTFGNTFFANGAKSSGVLSHPGILGGVGKKNIQASFEKEVKDSNKIMVLEEGMKYTQLTIPPDQAQFLQSKQFGIEEVARWYNLPQHLIGSLEHATFSNIEHQAIEFVQYNLRPRVKMYEQEFKLKLITNPKKFAAFNLNALMRGDAASRATYFATRFNIGTLSQNDIRSMEDENSIPGGDEYFTPLNLATNTEREKKQEQPAVQPIEKPANTDEDGTESN